MIGLLLVATLTTASPDPRCAARVDFHRSPRGIITTPRMAREVARIYLNAVYGADWIDRELPLKVSIARGVWHVEGQLPPGSVGGVAEIDLCQSTGRVLRMVHGQ